jgi:hypothetical protein
MRNRNTSSRHPRESVDPVISADLLWIPACAGMTALAIAGVRQSGKHQ